jgi:exodeoxyribonuclease V beta subunit
LDVRLGNLLSLRGISKVNRLTEMEFLLPLQSLQVNALKKILTHPDYKLHPIFKEAACTLDFEDLKGYLRGFIDLIVCSGDTFYVIDYKLHYLGEFIQDYAVPKLRDIIASEHYYLQYLIYLIALRSYLRSRALPLAIGGVYYLFLRGLDQQGCGVWFDQPDEKLLLALEALFFNKVSS